MKEEFLKKKAHEVENETALKAVSGGKKGKHFKVKEFTQKETQEEWIDLMGIPKK